MFEVTSVSGRGRRSWQRSDTLLASVAVHALFVALVAAHVRAAPPPAEPVEKDETVTFLQVLSELPPPPVFGEARSGAGASGSAAAEAGPRSRVAGVAAPREAPMEIPQPEAALAGPDLITASAGGLTEMAMNGFSAEAAAMPRSTLADGKGEEPVNVAMLAEHPRLVNRTQMGWVWRRLYPDDLIDSGVEGKTVVTFVINQDGRVDPETVIVLFSTHEGFEDAAVEGAKKLRFRPALLDGRAVRVRASIPVTWRVEA